MTGRGCRRRPSGPGSPRPSASTGRCASGSTRTRHCWPSGGSPTTPTGLERFAMSCVDALAGHVAVVKPQSAFFERHGSRGIAVLERVLAALRRHRHAVPARRQARRHRVDDGRLRRRLPRRGRAARRGRGDALALPGLRVARARRWTAAADAGRGVFVLARTSNPEGTEVQLAELGRAQHRAGRGRRCRRTQRGRPAARRRRCRGRCHRGPRPRPGRPRRRRAGPRTRGPGGGAGRHRRAASRGVRGIVLPSASRSVLRAGPDVVAMRAAALALRDELVTAVMPAS